MSVTESMRVFSQATGMKVRFLSVDGELLEDGHCSFSLRANLRDAVQDICLRHMEESGRQAESLGEAYISFCPMGYVTISVPFYVEGKVMGSLHSGPFLLWDGEDYAKSEDLGIPVVDSERIRALAELLRIFSERHGAPDEVKQRGDITRQQMKVADELINRKRQGEAQNERVARLGVYPLHKERELLGRVRLGDRNGARRILNEMLALIFYDTAGNMDVIKARVLELVVVISRAAVEGGAQLTQMLGADYNYLSELGTMLRFEDVCAWVVKMLDAFIDAVYSTRNIKSSRYLSGVIEYIQGHYAENVNLEYAASLVPISPYYLSHLFREELGMTFLEYVTKVRIEAAKRLLSEGEPRIRDVALMVGYDDAGYFSKVFRKMVGLSPNRYRKGIR